VVDSTINVAYKGGTVLRGNTSLYAIFWEPGNNVSPSYNSLIQRFLGDMNSSPLYQIAHQYGDFASFFPPTGTRFAAAWVDTSAYPQSPLLDSDIQHEVTRAKQVNGWSSDPNNIFLVYTERDADICFDSSHRSCASNSFCAYPGLFDATTSYGAVPYFRPLVGCGTDSTPNADLDADVAINQTSGTIFAATTAGVNSPAWRDRNSTHIVNKCAFQFGPRDPQGGNMVLNGHEYIVSGLWDNFTASCRTSPSTTILPGTWSSCGIENGGCPVFIPETIAFGANGGYTYRTPPSGTLPCNTGALGDPKFGTYKACYFTELPATWTPCAGENAFCSFTGSTLSVAYGANGAFSFRTLTNGTTCNNATFGDPVSGVVKSCFIMAPPPGTVVWTKCADEGQTCTFNGAGGTHEVVYGSHGAYAYRNVTATPTSGVVCSSAFFGDPNPGEAKASLLGEHGLLTSARTTPTA
jgi:hypothetical protein